MTGRFQVIDSMATGCKPSHRVALLPAKHGVTEALTISLGGPLLMTNSKCSCQWRLTADTEREK